MNLGEGYTDDYYVLTIFGNFQNKELRKKKCKYVISALKNKASLIVL